MYRIDVLNKDNASLVEKVFVYLILFLKELPGFNFRHFEHEFLMMFLFTMEHDMHKTCIR